ncbi:MAG TPA: hypothetical protein PLI74_12715, partial [Candidatus Kapabacteria bacterium]|nr:hypothetical protein [Candidatus Kapabacteria bacterium]
HNVIAVPLQSVTVRQSEEKSDNDTPKDMTAEKKSANEKNKRPPTIVFLNINNKAKQTKVETGLSDQGYIEITSGIKEGDEIISGNFQAINKLLNDNDKIIIDNSSEKKKK